MIYTCDTKHGGISYYGYTDYYIIWPLPVSYGGWAGSLAGMVWWYRLAGSDTSAWLVCYTAFWQELFQRNRLPARRHRWYRLHIKPDESWRGRQISICFDGVYKNSRIWCNSYYLGERPNGYISFSYDITEQFRYDADNIISVYVDHREIADSRWYTGSGITRKVTLRIEESIHPVENGIFFSTPQVNSEQAVCEITQELVNCTGQDNQVTVTSLLFAPDDTLISEQIAHQEIAHMTHVSQKCKALYRIHAVGHRKHLLFIL